METAHFSKIVEAAGRPVVHVLWIDPDNDPILKDAIKAGKVMTVHQGLTNGKADYGTVGFERGVSGQILIFPKSLKRFADKRVTGVKYDLLDSDSASVPRGQPAPKSVPFKRMTKSKARETKVRATAERSVVEEKAAATVVKFFDPKESDADGSAAEVEEIKKQVVLAMKALEDGKQIAAFNLLKRIVDR